MLSREPALFVLSSGIIRADTCKRSMTITNEQFVVFLYEALFNREEMSTSDVAHWVAQLDSGLSPLDVYGAFLSTPEGHHRFFKNKYFEQFFSRQSTAFPFYRGTRNLRACSQTDDR
jgi:hypothetical protein